jgi:adenosine deaminase
VQQELGIGVGLMPAGDRTLDPAIAVEQAELAASHAGRGVVAFGLSNDEAIGPLEHYADAFAVAREAGLLCTPHAGELAGPDQVAFALDVLGADRIEHGVRAVEDVELVRRLADAGVCLDVCLTSNVMLSVVADAAEHPLPALLDAGVRCTVNTDDSLLFGPGLLDEYELARDAFGLDDAALAAIARTSIEASGAPERTKREAAAGIDAWLAAPPPV